jgi:hypothetical protein
MFRRPTVRYDATPEPATPYEKAGQVRDERIGCHRNLPLLPHQGRTRRDRSSKIARRGGRHSGYDLMEFGARSDATQIVPRVGR